MDIFTKFNRNKIQDRQVDTLIGLSKGITADGKVDQAEAEFLQSWLVQNYHTDNPIIMNLLDKVTVMLEDGILDPDESTELLSILRLISGEETEIGEVAKPSALPVCSPAPSIAFEDSLFLFTGTFAYGTRKECQQAIESLGGLNAKGVTKNLNYLVLGTYVTDSWAHESFGRKIEKAMAYRDSGVPLSIITEEHWVNEAGF
ncbi:BRCT domain-containing protein [uncultured Methylophaga sp.]|uniref:BRCT domain-containing protein n=1 Tax=uncultured Methylophaga sp. TaxID=285271 RepID=UPI002619BC7D|nr:BRCT domain-containing protein [uncultured Methylophaga sp.]